jgi:hypothetical protein
MAGRNELPPRNPLSPEDEFLLIVEGIKIPYDSCCEVGDLVKKELGLTSFSGRVGEKYYSRITEEFYGFLGRVKELLPEEISLDEGLETVVVRDNKRYVGSVRPIVKFFSFRTNKVVISSSFGVVPPEDKRQNLWVKDISFVLSCLENVIKDGENREDLDNTSRRIDSLKEQWKKDFFDKVDELAPQMKTRILNLKRSVARYCKLPKFIIVGPSIAPDDERWLYFLPKEERLVLAPVVEKKNRIFRTTKQIPDFSKCEDAPDGSWAVAVFLAQDFLKPLPTQIKMFILQ